MLMCPKFIANLYRCLESYDYEDILTWSDNGQSFTIRDVNSLPLLLKVYFKDVLVKSFFRQLQLYKFLNIKSSTHSKTYRHPQFHKGMNLNVGIKRTYTVLYDLKQETRNMMRELQQLTQEQVQIWAQLKNAMNMQQKIHLFLIKVKRVYYSKTLERLKAEYMLTSHSRKKIICGVIMRLFLNHKEHFYIGTDPLQFFEMKEEIYTPLPFSH